MIDDRGRYNLYKNLQPSRLDVVVPVNQNIRCKLSFYSLNYSSSNFQLYNVHSSSNILQYILL